ncbi:hypothetical protein ACH4KT_24735 [Streptomyces anulatus]
MTVAAALRRDAQVGQKGAATAARVVSAVTLLAMRQAAGGRRQAAGGRRQAAGENVAASVDEIVRDIREQIAAQLTR